MDGLFACVVVVILFVFHMLYLVKLLRSNVVCTILIGFGTSMRIVSRTRKFFLSVVHPYKLFNQWMRAAISTVCKAELEAAGHLKALRCT